LGNQDGFQHVKKTDAAIAEGSPGVQFLILD